MNRLIENTVFSGLVTACRLATWPTRISPSFVNPTTDGVTRLPSWLGMTTASPPSTTATTEFVVPRSMPITLAMPTSTSGHGFLSTVRPALASTNRRPRRRIEPAVAHARLAVRAPGMSLELPVQALLVTYRRSWRIRRRTRCHSGARHRRPCGRVARGKGFLRRFFDVVHGPWRAAADSVPPVTRFRGTEQSACDSEERLHRSRVTGQDARV